MRFLCFWSLFVFWGCQSRTDANHEQQNAVLASIPLCTTGQVVSKNLADFSPPTFRTGIGNSHLTISTKNKEAQHWFDQGLNHLHGFWHLEAFRAFQQVTKADSACAMGYWGLAMCQPGFGGDDMTTWTQAIDKAVSLQNNVSPLEKALIDATALLVKQGLNEATAQKFRTLYKTYPNEPEAIAFAAIMLRQDSKVATQAEVRTLLEKSMRRFPDHVAMMHYYVHVMELQPDFKKAVAIAKRMVQLAPNAPHLIHMPGHLYYLAGDYEKAVAAYTAAQQQETTYHTTEKIPFSANQNYIHNLHFLAVAQAEAADKQEALATATTLSNLTLSTTIPNDGAKTMMLYEGRILPALVHIRFREWPQAIAYFDKLLNSLDQPITNPFAQKYLKVMQLYCLGMQSPLSPEGDKYGMELSQLMEQYQQEAIAMQNTPEFKSINETYDIMSIARYELAGWIDNMDKTNPFNEAAWKEAVSLQNAIKYDEPPRLMYPIEESLARLHKIRGEKEAYQISKRLALLKRPNSKTIQRI
jgi:tetratricopeptide (TPR) repeat protein